MRKIRIFEHMSLDGVIQSSGEDNFPYENWTTPYRTPAGLATLVEKYGERYDLLLGRRTYDILVGVLAQSAEQSDGGPPQRGNEVCRHAQAGEPGMGPGRGAWVGTGKRFFASGTPARAFTLEGTQAFPSGIVVNTYKAAGPLV
jgi:hypothetical protein